ncbi:MAG: polyprenyl synthetase family protein [Candidatus Marsarchaeota archaeon]|nr:polyprenyl synthetase family protein [Candidatus Marsarchaeota archaeon]
MDFKEYIAEHKKMVYSTICDYVQIKEPKAHYSIMRDYIDRQGSYRRPGLILLTGQMFGVSTEQLRLPASAMQLSEDWILMQDDVEDDSELRRGKPAAHKLYGWIHTMNATNVGQIAMWRMLKDYILKYGVQNGNKIYEKFYDMLAYTMEGQYIENNFIYDIKNLSKVSEDFYFKVVDSKTCYYTVYGPLQVGAIAANQPESTLEILKKIGTPGGISFQITDDILDIIADEKVFGKKNLGDLYEGKVTLIMLNTYKNATAVEKARIDAIYLKSRKNKTPEEINFLLELIKKYDSIDYAKDVAKKYGELAKIAVEENMNKLPNNEYTTMLLSSIKDLYSRNK